MSELNLNKIRAAFHTLGLSELDYFSYEELLLAIGKLNQHEFDQQTYEELWDQCKLNSKGYARLSDFMEFVLKAEDILLEKRKQIEQQRNKYEMERKNKNAAGDIGEQRRLKESIDSLQEEKEAVNNSLDIIRKPFVHYVSPRKSPQKIKKMVELPIQQIQNDNLLDYDSASTSDYLFYIFYLNLSLALLSCLAYLQINRTLDILVYLLIISCFLVENISRITIKFSFYMLLFTVLVDILWICLYISQLWSPPLNYELTSNMNAYLRLTFTLSILCMIGKLILLYLLASQFRLDEGQIYQIKVLNKQLFFQKEQNITVANKSPFIFAIQQFIPPSPPQQ